jgi:hypothetical protein
VSAVAVGIAAAAFRLPHALSDAFWQDEVASARILREPTIVGLVRHVARTESTPPLWYALGWLTHRAGVSIHDVRLLSVAFGALFAGLTVLLARRVLPLPSAVLAGILVAVGGEFVQAGHELRAYALLALLTVLFAVALDAEVRRPSHRATLALFLVTAAGTLTHYFFLFTVAAGVTWLLLDPGARHARRRAAGAIAAGLIVSAAWFPVLLRQYHQARFAWIGPFDVHAVANAAFRLFTPLGATGATAVLVPLAFLGVTCFGALQLARQSALGRLCAALAVVPLVLAGGTWLVGVRIFAMRNMIGIGAFVAIAVAGALAALAPRARTVAVALVATAAFAGFAWDQRSPAAPYAGIAQALVAEGWNAHDPVVVFGSFYALRSPLEWYLPRAPDFGVLQPARSDCRLVYAVAGRRAAPTLADDVVRGRAVGRFLVARVRLDDSLAHQGASVLAAPAAWSRCARRSAS